MGKKAKIGKQRRDKFYQLAKEAGYRSRAAFKLIQLNKRFEFLQNSRAVVDLCAAPGGWMQVASQNMPISSICIGVDLAPIKPIPNCIALQGDITTEKTRQMIKKELQNWQADTVLHDGAPNVGTTWIHDAFQQNCLTLMALKLATQILKKNGTFVTKVFRSNDYHCLITVFEKLFKRVHVWKPAASRLESAEIFVVCEKYFKPSKVDPDLLDSKKVFLEPNLEPTKPNSQAMLVSNKKERKAKAEGYAEDESITMYRVVDATKLIEAHEYLDVLAQCSSIKLDQEKWSNAPETTDEIREYLADIKVCGPRELRIILKWRKKMRAILEKEAEELEAENKGNEVEVEMEVDEEEAEDKALAELEVQIAQADADEKAALKKKKRKMLLEKAKLLKRRQLKMVHDNDPGLVDEQPDLFALKKIRKAKLSAIAGDDVEAPDAVGEDGEFGLGDGDWETKENEDGSDDGGPDSGDDDDSDNELIHTNETGMSKVEKKETRTEHWFNKNEISELVSSDDEDDEMNIIEKHMKRNKATMRDNTVSFTDDSDKKKKKKKGKDEEESEDDLDVHEDDIQRKRGEEEEEEENPFANEIDMESDEEYEDEDKRIAKRKVDEKRAKIASASGEVAAKKRHLTPEQLALAEQLIYSTKSRRDLEEWGWNRFTHNDENLPDWFVEDEKKHNVKQLPVTKEQVRLYRERMRELDARPIKRVAEAKARKLRRAKRKLDMAKKKAESIVENDNMEHNEKVREMKKIYRKATKKEVDKVNIVVVSKSKAGKLGRPQGRYKPVDKRMKTELRAQKTAERRAGKKRSSKGGVRTGGGSKGGRGGGGKGRGGRR